MPQKINPKILIGIGIIILVVILLLLLVLRRSSSGNNQSGITPTVDVNATPTTAAGRGPIERPDPSSVPSIFQQSQEYLDEQTKMDLTLAPENAKSKKAGELLTKVPYKGQLFTFDYSADDLAFKVIFNKDQVIEANQEFDEYLKKNGIEDKSWLYGLKIEYK